MCYQLISEHFGENCVTLRLTGVNLQYTKLCVVFLEQPVCQKHQ